MKEVEWRATLRKILEPICDRTSTQMLTAAGLLVGTVSAATAKTGAAICYACLGGMNGSPSSLVAIAAGTAMPALTGFNLTAGQYGICCFFVNSAGVLSIAAGTPGATLGAATFPQMSKQQALVGFIVVTYASAFTGGTTALSTATTLYFSPTGAFDPTVLI
jgi:hypothetical protein